jgi:hypothetical protein
MCSSAACREVGTSVLGRNIGRLENCSGLTNTDALDDEEQFFQGLYSINW